MLVELVVLLPPSVDEVELVDVVSVLVLPSVVEEEELVDEVSVPVLLSVVEDEEVVDEVSVLVLIWVVEEEEPVDEVSAPVLLSVAEEEVPVADVSLLVPPCAVEEKLVDEVSVLEPPPVIEEVWEADEAVVETEVLRVVDCSFPGVEVLWPLVVLAVLVVEAMVPVDLRKYFQNHQMHRESQNSHAPRRYVVDTHGTIPEGIATIPSLGHGVVLPLLAGTVRLRNPQRCHYSDGTHSITVLK